MAWVLRSWTDWYGMGVEVMERLVWDGCCGHGQTGMGWVLRS